MKTYLAAAAVAAALAQPAAAITFPSLTTIYVGAGVRDDGGNPDAGVATTFICSNVSGQAATIRYLLLDSSGTVVADVSFVVQHGATNTLSTHGTSTFVDTAYITGIIGQGVVNIESTQSAVFCTALIVDAGDIADMAPLRLVRINGHPGAEE